MVFSYSDYKKNSFYRPDSFGALGMVSPVEFSRLQNQYDKDGDNVDRTLRALNTRTTSDYYRKVYRAQTGVLSYSKKVFPTYKFIMPDALSDDWLSTVDWHKKYPTRDHSLHQTLTAYIVANLLGNGNEKQSFTLPNGDKLLDYCCNTILAGNKTKYLLNYAKSIGVDFDNLHTDVQKRWVKDLFYEAAVVSALFHDMGYPWQYINSLAKSIEVAEYGETINVVCDALLTKNTIKNRLLIYPFYGYSEITKKHAPAQIEKRVVELIERGLRETHGLPGAIGFMCLNDRTRRYRQIPTLREASYQLVLDWATVGIMMHDMAGLYWDDKDKKKPKNPILRLSFDLDPLSSLICMADILEEFHRPIAQFYPPSNKGGSTKVELDYDYSCETTKIYLKEQTLCIRYLYKNHSDAALNRNRRKAEVDEYFASPNGYVDLSSLGISSVDCDTDVIKA